jgi:hypothetical protein
VQGDVLVSQHELEAFHSAGESLQHGHDGTIQLGDGASVNGSRRWLRLGPLNFQASEAARVCLLFYLCGYLVRREAVVMAMSDVFLSLTIIYILLVFLVPFMRSPAPFASQEGGGH